MSTITTQDGTQIYYNDWGKGPPIVFSHGWPLTADAFEDQMFYLASRGYRCIAHDRRGHGRSSQPWDGNDMDTYADDLAALVKALNLEGAIHIGHSTGGSSPASRSSRTFVPERKTWSSPPCGHVFGVAIEPQTLHQNACSKNSGSIPSSCGSNSPKMSWASYVP